MIQDRVQWLKAGSVALAALAWTVASHLASANPEPSTWGALLALAPMMLISGAALKRLSRLWLACVLALLIGAILIWIWPELRTRVALLYFLQQIGIYGLLAFSFGRTLQGEGEPLITQLARRMNKGVLSDQQLRYTRTVTQAWVVFFLAVTAISALLFFTAPVAVWSFFSNVLSGPLILAMFAGEYIVRRQVLPNEPKRSFSSTIEAWREHQSESSR
jgi:uncharacterized membrane protein